MSSAARLLYGGRVKVMHQLPVRNQDKNIFYELFFSFFLLQKTTNYENRDKINQVLEKVGGICDCQSAR